jgi:hypothetical protein
MKLFVVGAVLLLMSAASMADTLPGAAGPPAKSDTPSGAKAPPGADKAPGPSCRKAAYGTCQGCSITCAQGEKAVCSDPLYNWNANKCVRDAACRCKPPKRS